jgi:hypothetical protein
MGYTSFIVISLCFIKDGTGSGNSNKAFLGYSDQAMNVDE